MSHKTKSLIFAFLALFSWGIHGPAGRYLAVQEINMYFVAVSRFWIGTFIFFLFLVFKGDFGYTLFKSKWKEILKISIVGICLNSILYHLTLKYLHGTLVMILENLAPVFVLLIVYFKDKIVPTKNQMISLIVAMIGLITIVVGKSSFPELGDGYTIGIILGILTGITFGAYIYLSSKLMMGSNKEPLTIIQLLFWIFLLASVMMSPIYFFLEGKLPRSQSEIFWFLEMGIFQSGVAYLLWNFALTGLSANTASILFTFTVLFTTINEVLFLNLKINPTLIFGGLLITIAGYLLSKRPSKKILLKKIPQL